MLLIDVHQFDIVLAEPVVFRAFEHEVHDIGGVLSLQCQDVIGLRASQHLGERAEIDTERDVPIAAERREGFGLKHHGYECDVGVVHGLQRDTGVIAVEVAVLDEILDCIDNLECC